jgi:benzodiazapine receptor
MGITLFMLWQRITFASAARKAIIIFIVQLILNVIWSVLFFAMHSPFLAFLEIIVLWIAILATIIASCKVSRIAGSLLIPYILWVSFASALNFSIWQLNP